MLAKASALVIQPEHRYYGTSPPFGEAASFTNENLQLATPQQALADTATFITGIRAARNCSIRAGTARRPRLCAFELVKRSDTALVGAPVALGSGGGLSGGGLGSDHAIEDVLRTRWPGAVIDWAGQPPPSID